MTEQEFWEDYYNPININKRFDQMAKALEEIFNKWRK